MRLILVAALFQAALCGNVNIRMPYLNPAGVTYVDSSLHAGLAAGPLAYTTATARPYIQGGPISYGAAPVAYGAAPVAYGAAPVAYGAAPVAHVAPVAPVAPLAYSAPLAYQPVTKYAAVPTVQHVHGVADVPVTRYEAQPAVIQKALDVAKPAIKTRKYEIRRPAIEKQFYDIEERVVVRPAGSALVELDEPISKAQKGAAIVSPAAYAIPALPAAPVFRAAPVLPAIPAVRAAPILPAFRAAPIVPALPAYARLQPFYGVAGIQKQYQFTQVAPGQLQPAPPSVQAPDQSQTVAPYPFEPAQSTPAPPPQPIPSPLPQPQQPPQPLSDDDDSVSVDNPEFSRRSAPPQGPMPNEQEAAAAESLASRTPAPEAEAVQARRAPESRSVGPAPLQYSSYDLIPQARFGPSLVPSLRNLGPEVSQANQQRLIELFTARGGVTEVGLGRAGPAVNSVGDAGQIRARVLSATPAPPSSEPTGERVNTRRVVVSRPIETLQEIEVQEPVTKLERIHVNHPTFIKTARQELVRVPTSVPVYGKALTPVAHGALPVPAVPSYSTYYG